MAVLDRNEENMVHNVKGLALCHAEQTSRKESKSMDDAPLKLMSRQIYPMAPKALNDGYLGG